jgi:hypothetical protein
MSLISKVDLLNREKLNLQNHLEDANKKISNLTDDVAKLNK